MKRYISSLMAFCLMFALVLPVEAKEAESFRDVPADFWAYEQINRCVQDGIVSGYSDGTFKPGNPVSYGAFSIMLARAFYSDELAAYSDQGTATGEAIMNKHGILNGTSRSSASIGASLPREDMAQIMYNVLKDKGANIPPDTEYVKCISSISDFQSININCRRAVMVCYTTGLLGGQSDGSFGPKNPMNRAQGCVVINRLRDYFQNNGGTTDPVGPTTPTEPATPTDPATPTVTELPAFKLQDGETVQQMMTRIMANVTYTPGYLSNGQPITEDNIKALLAEIETSMPEGTPWDEDDRFNYSGKLGYGGACNSWGYAVSDYLFGKEAPLTKHQNFDQLKVGDVVWMKNSKTGYSHVYVVTSLTNPYWGEDAYSICDGNNSNGVSWDGDGRFSTFEKPEVASGTYIYSRY
ncbi:S-layer homology domain-containing protein [uncultured Oscillibacter sp.]|uniref:S-layer homology domain-containing protein n=1 Tax=uncultured Oscillibacter sp. TaxID=876091 RepID=UPI00272963C6|nr:S-layer homology domain-containing protein [uncultured Oscillibacter sp.]